MKPLFASFVIVIAFAACKGGAEDKILTDPHILHRNTKQLTEVIIYDIFNPPVASRIYAYTSLAAYEAIRHAEKGYPSLTAQLHGFPDMPKPDDNKKYNYLLAATRAFFTVAEKVTFAIDTLKKYENKVFADFKAALDEEVYNNSMAFGDTIGKAVLQRTTVDSYKKTRGMPKYLGSTDMGRWRPTPQDYFDGVEPYWNLILPLAMDSASQFKPAPPPPFSTDTTSMFYTVMKEVYVIGKTLTEEQKTIAKYWDDNPAVMEHSGHMMFFNKKITPVGHWIGITGIACGMKDLKAVEIAQAYAITAVAFFDGFISCWNEKYRSQFIRPVTAINEVLDKNWQSFLQTPPFPEHTSGHSTISAAAATVLTKRFGENFAFEDTSDLEYIGMKRNFKSFFQAADEASISRIYGGIHYRTGTDEGALNGRQIGEYINSKIRLRE
jgi:hypothetical protein